MLWSALVFVSLFVTYHANRSVLDEGDALTSTLLPVAILSNGALSFDPESFPSLFKWKGHAPFAALDDLYVESWKQVFGDRTAREWRNAGKLELNGPRYYLVESPIRHVYVSTFGPMPGIALFPFVAPFFAVDPELWAKPALRASIGKLCASTLVSVTAVLIFLMAERRTTRRRALLLAFTYGVGSCAWAVSSQSMWQQTLNQALLAAGAFFLLGNVERWGTAALTGAFFGMAAACRATGAIALVAAAVYVALVRRRSLLPFLALAFPPLIGIAVHNVHYFGGVFSSGQSLAGHAIALEKTGSPALWQTPLWLGAIGLLGSPSRGLLVFSPVLAPGLFGLVRVLGDRRYGALRPLAVYTACTMALQCKWFDWWGGHTYGYRPWLDVVPYLVLFMLPTLEAVLKTAIRRVVYGALLAWSAFVQGLGALAYDHTWNTRSLYVVRLPDNPSPLALFEERKAREAALSGGGSYVGSVNCNVDLAPCRYRLWSLTDSIIPYSFLHFTQGRHRRLPETWSAPGAPL